MSGQLNPHQRLKALPEEVRELAIRHPFVQRVTREYVTGNIPTVEDALTKMVIGLAAESKDARDHLLRYIVKFGSADFFPGSTTENPVKLDCVGTDGCKVSLPIKDCP